MKDQSRQVQMSQTNMNNAADNARSHKNIKMMIQIKKIKL